MNVRGFDLEEKQGSHERIEFETLGGGGGFWCNLKYSDCTYLWVATIADSQSSFLLYFLSIPTPSPHHTYTPSPPPYLTHSLNPFHPSSPSHPHNSSPPHFILSSPLPLLTSSSPPHSLSSPPHFPPPHLSSPPHFPPLHTTHFSPLPTSPCLFVTLADH